jgi:hypothetical protein
MNERLVEDWLAKANERSYQTPFAQSLLADGFEILRIGHSAHEHGKDIIALDNAKKVHAYQLKDGEPIVLLFARRLWRNTLAGMWSQITKVDIIRLVPDSSYDLLMWRWGNSRGRNQNRKFSVRQSWETLLAESRRNEDETLPAILKSDVDFALLFMLCFPHRLTTGLAKYLDTVTRKL